MTNHPDDPRAGDDDAGQAEYEACYNAAYAFARAVIMAAQAAAEAALPLSAMLEEMKIGAEGIDILKYDQLAIMAMDADGVAHEWAAAQAEAMDVGSVEYIDRVGLDAIAEGQALKVKP
jgi:DNA polymerase III psi subunit